MSKRFLVKSTTTFFVLSLLVHGVVVLLSLWSQSSFKLDKRMSSNQTINIEILEPEIKTKTDNVKKNKQEMINKMRIVDQEKVNDELDLKSKLLSSHNQKVKNETVAKNSGAFENQKKLIQSKSEKNNRSIRKTHNTPMPRDLFGSFKNSLAKSLENQKDKESINQQNGSDVSRTQDYLPDKADGLETLLSTREFVYYSYYTRIRNQLSEYWEPKIKQKVLTLFRQGRTIASAEDKITKVQIVLDSKGLLQKVQVLGASGVRDLDEVAVDAFRAAAPFPNPPKGIIESDGTVKIEWDFVVET